MRRWARRVALGVLVAFAAWHGSQGLYIEAKARLAQYLVLRAWNAARAGALHARPWPWADTEPVARLVVPGEDVELIILAGASGRTLAFGPGHLTGTALPGEDGNAVVSGHRDTHFAFLAELRPGDDLSVERRDGRWRRYVVSTTEIVDRHQLAVARDTQDTRLTLVTCYPFAALRPGGPLRYVVTAVSVQGPARAFFSAGVEGQERLSGMDTIVHRGPGNPRPGHGFRLREIPGTGTESDARASGRPRAPSPPRPISGARRSRRE